MVHALVEADITKTRSAIKLARKDSKKYISLVGFILFSIAKSLKAYKEIQACRDWRNRIIIFDDVDISTTVERKISGNDEVIPTIIRSANKKSLYEILRDIKEAKTTLINDAEVYRSIKKYLSIPFFIRRLTFKLLDKFPVLMKNKAGTIMVTSANAVGIGSVWGIPIASHSLNVTIGGIKQASEYQDGTLNKKEILCLTISFNHNLID